MKYIKELDSIRAIAVFFVILCHWMAPGLHVTTLHLGALGAIGVDIFFVLSGFLITGILLEGKLKSEKNEVTLKNVFKNFYIRRALRIFPIFYLVITLLFIAHIYYKDITLEELTYSATYTVNFLFHKTREWSGYTTHFWSLAVEEQFYLIWPMTMLFFKKQWLPYIILIFMATGVISQLWDNNEFGYLVTYACFDAFAAGAIFAWMIRYKKDLVAGLFKIVRILAIFSIIIIGIEFYQGHYFKQLPQRTLHSAVALWLIMTIVIKNQEDLKNPIKLILGNKVLIFLGRISYGIYLYHIYIPYFTNYIYRSLTGRTIIDTSKTLASPNILFFLVNLLLVVLVAWVSWTLIEKPILNFKRYFNYQRTSKIAPATL